MYKIIQQRIKQEEMLIINGKKVFDNQGNLVGNQFLEDLNTIDVYERASNFKKSVLIIHGTNDEIVPFEVSKRYQQKACHSISSHTRSVTYNRSLNESSYNYKK